MGNIIYIPCSNCGSLLPRHPYRVRRSKYHFCNTTCRQQWMKQNRSICGDKNPRWSGGLITIYCDNCGNTLYRKKSAVLEHNFCNQKCVAAWKSNQKTSSNVALVEGGKVKVQCDFCGGDIIKKASHAKNLNFCNRTCQAGWRKQNKSGKNSPRWRERVNIICDNCGGEIQREKHLIKRGS